VEKKKTKQRSDSPTAAKREYQGHDKEIKNKFAGGGPVGLPSESASGKGGVVKRETKAQYWKETSTSARWSLSFRGDLKDPGKARGGTESTRGEGGRNLSLY